MNQVHYSLPLKRKLLLLPLALSLLPFRTWAGTLSRMGNRFRGITGVTIVIDVVNAKEYITISTDTGRQIASPSLLGPGAKGRLSFSGANPPIPEFVHITWREGRAKYDFLKGQGWSGGTVLGDYTVAVASRIPDEILKYITSPAQGDVMGRGLRIKIRLKDDGVLVAWDVEEGYKNQYGNFARFVMPGGDFIETRF